MPHYNCCVSGCKNNFRKAPQLQYYRIPKLEEHRKTYKAVLGEKTNNLEAKSTRICSAHFEGGRKLSRNHLPTIFPWFCINKTPKSETRQNLEDIAISTPTKKTKYDTELLNADEAKENSNACETGFHEVHLNNLEELNPDDNIYIEQDTETFLSSKDIDRLLSIEKQFQDIQKPEDNVNIEQETETFLSSKDIDRLLSIEKQFQDIQKENKKLKLENEKLKEDIVRMKFDMQKQVRFNIEKYKDNDEDVTFYTGFPDYNAMTMCYSIVEESAKNLNYDHEKINTDRDDCRKIGRPRTLTTFEEFTMVVMRLRLGLFEKDLAHRFNVSVTSVCRILRTWIRFLRCEFEPLINIPPREVIKLHMPEVFKNFYPNLTIIVDCTEIEMEKPSSLNAQSTCYSSYKSRNTMKALIGITPSGVINFVSEFFPGSASDKEIVVQSGFLAKLKQGDEVMADKGFNCQDELASVGAKLILPHMLKGITQFSREQTAHNKKVASLRIHVERVMERIKNWHIYDHRIPISTSALASDILIVVCAMSNFHPPLIN